jgi:hypothetical protein
MFRKNNKKSDLYNIEVVYEIVDKTKNNEKKTVTEKIPLTITDKQKIDQLKKYYQLITISKGIAYLHIGLCILGACLFPFCDMSWLLLLESLNKTLLSGLILVLSHFFKKHIDKETEAIVGFIANRHVCSKAILENIACSENTKLN